MYNSYVPAATTPKFQRLVFVLVDALRADFVLSLESNIKALPKMEFTRDRIASGGACAFLAKAHAPTVTMPRLKVQRAKI